MFRLLVLFLVFVLFVVPLIRMVIGAVARIFSNFAFAPTPPQQPQSNRAVPAIGELKKDPVCGTFVSTASSVKHSEHGEVVHFCSPPCRDKYLRSRA